MVFKLLVSKIMLGYNVVFKGMTTTPEKTIEVCDYILDFNPNYKTALFLKADALREQNKYVDSIEYYDKAIEIDPYFVLALNNKAISLSALKKYDEAIECYNKVLKLDKRNTVAIANKASVYYEKEDYNATLECYDEYLNFVPNDVRMLSFKSNCYYKLNEFDKANEILVNLLDKYPNCLSVLSTKAKNLSESSYVEKIKIYNKIINMPFDYNDPVVKDESKCEAYDYLNNIKATAYFSRGFLLWRCVGDLENALYSFLEGLKIDPDDTYDVFNCAVIYFELGDYDSCNEFLDNVLLVYPDLEDAFYYKARISEIEGNNLKAIGFYEEILEINPDCERALNNINNLKEVSLF